jgi:hypothetical protein
LRRVRNPDRIGEWQSRDGRIARDAEGQSGPEPRGRGLVGRGSLKTRALISGSGNSVVAVRSATSIGRVGVLQSPQSTTGWSVAVIGNAERPPNGPAARL